jgi:hypothetical protein
MMSGIMLNVVLMIVILMHFLACYVIILLAMSFPVIKLFRAIILQDAFFRSGENDVTSVGSKV